MEFLYKLYSNNYFGIGLFVVITVLAFLFLIILFFGKKDEKKRIKEEKELAYKQQEINNIDKAVNKDLPKENIESPVLESLESNKELVDKIDTYEDISKIENDIFEEKESYLESDTVTKDDDSFVTSNLVLNSELVSNDDLKDIELKNDNSSNEADIYNLDSLMNEDVDINMEEESIDDVLNKYDALEEKMIDNHVTYNIERTNEDNQIVNEYKEDLLEKSNSTIKKSSILFSSVYASKDETPIQEEVVTEPKQETSSRATFDLPKRMDLPKRSTSAINGNIISSFGINDNTNSSQDDNYLNR